MKRLTLFFLIAALLVASLGALAEQPSHETAARSLVPENAELLRTEKDDGLLEYLFMTPDDTRYQVDVNPSTGNVVKLELEAFDKRGASTATLTQEQAEQALFKYYPEATITFSKLERDDGRYVYQIRFSTDMFGGKAELHAETGALLEAELDYTVVRTNAQKPLSAEEAKALALSQVENGRIVEFETDRDDGRTEYEGEIIADGISYEFTINAESGAVIEWHIDR